MIKCSKCDLEATCYSPQNLCEYHWAEWWVEGLLEESPYTPQDKEAMIQETMKISSKNKSRDK